MKLLLPDGKVIEGTQEEIAFILETKKPATNIEPKLKRTYIRKNRRNQWSGEEIDKIANNLDLSIRQLSIIVPGRTSKTIGQTKWMLKNNRLTKGKQETYNAFLRR